MVRIAAWIALGLLTAIVLAAVGARLYVASARGQAAVLHRLERETRARTGLGLRARSLGGSLLFGARLGDVEVTDAAGRRIARAPEVRVHWRPLGWVTRHPHVDITVARAQLSIFGRGSRGGVDVPLTLDWRDGVVDARLGPMALDAEELRALAPLHLQARRGVRIEGHVRGPLDDLRAELAADSGGGVARVSARGDARTRRADGVVVLDGVATDFVPSAQPMVLWGRGTLSLRGDRLDVTLTARYRHRAPPADLVGAVPPRALRRFAVTSPGGTLHALVQARLDDGIDAVIRARLDEPGGTARTLDPRAPARPLLVRGRLRARAGQAPTLRVRSETP